MSFREKKYACLGFIFIPRRPQLLVNKYHTICCGLSGVVYDLGLVKGRDNQEKYVRLTERKKVDHLFDSFFGCIG